MRHSGNAIDPREIDFLLFKDWIPDGIKTHAQRSRLKVYGFEDSENERSAFFCGLIASHGRAESLKSTEWELDYWLSLPEPVLNEEGGVRRASLEHFTAESEVRPLVLVRNFPGRSGDYLELLEEFRLFHNLYHERSSNGVETYTRLDPDGSEEIVARLSNGTMEINLFEIKQYLAWTEMSFALFFDVTRFSPHTIDELGLQENYVETFNESEAYHYGIQRFAHGGDTKRTMSYIHGKVLLGGLPLEESNIGPFERPPEHESFIVDTDDSGRPVVQTCDPEIAGYGAGPNRGKYGYLTTVYFKKTVLARYYDSPGTYEVSDGALNRRSLWHLRLDNNHPDYVIVFLGDLGHLPVGEQRYWKEFNVKPDGSLSSVAIRRAFYGQWAEPTEPGLVFQYRFREFVREWSELVGWPLFKPLHANDEHHFKALHVPVTNDFLEFDSQVISLTKMLTDSLNSEELTKRIGEKIPKDAKSIARLEIYLEEVGFPDTSAIAEPLKRLQRIRSISSAHRKGSNHTDQLAEQGVDVSDLRSSFTILLNASTSLIGRLSGLLDPRYLDKLNRKVATSDPQ